MLNETEPTMSFEEAAEFIRNFPRRSRWQRREVSGLSQPISDYLQADKQKLKEAKEQAVQAGNLALVRLLSRRLEYYYLVEDFFLYLAEQDYSPPPGEVSTAQVHQFLQRQRPTWQYKPLKQALIPGLTEQRAQNREITELRAFFERAEQVQLLRTNPMTPFDKARPRLKPAQLFFRTLADSRAFERFLQERVERNLISPHTAKVYGRYVRILLHDVGRYHAEDPAWPTELDELFTDPQWLAQWLNQLKPRSPSDGHQLARSTLKLYLTTIRYLWLFLKLQGRTSPTFYTDLKALFLLDERIMILPGRKPRVIKALSEAEEQAVFACIERYSSSPVLKLRDQAMFITALETAIRVDGLNQMRIEQIKETEPGVFVCFSRVKRSSRKSGSSIDHLAGDQMEWRDWFMSPRAIEVIGTYLQATGRDWQSQGPVWLTDEGQPLALSRQKGLIREWLQMAGCKFTRPHVLRHTAVERMINKYQLPVPVVQQISQHANTKILLDVYAQGATEDAFRRVNQVLPMAEQSELNSQELVLAVGARLNGLSARISRRQQEKQRFSQRQLLELIEALNQETERLSRFLGYAPSKQVIPLSTQDYRRLEDLLQNYGLSYQQILGHDPTTPPERRQPGRPQAKAQSPV